MKTGLLEHVNMTVSDPDKTAAMLVKLFDWKVRWRGPSKDEGLSVHVGTDDAYVALYTHSPSAPLPRQSYNLVGTVNHLGILVEDLDSAEQRVREAGIKTHSHQVYDPGARFYFHDHDGIEYEVVSYA